MMLKQHTHSRRERTSEVDVLDCAEGGAEARGAEVLLRFCFFFSDELGGCPSGSSLATAEELPDSAGDVSVDELGLSASAADRPLIVFCRRIKG